jgi:hypothetical protein
MPLIGLLRLVLQCNKRALLVLTSGQAYPKKKEIYMRRQRRRRTLRDYEAMTDNLRGKKVGINPDGTPRESYAPVMPDPYVSPHEKPVYGRTEDRYEPYDAN